MWEMSRARLSKLGYSTTGMIKMVLLLSALVLFKTWVQKTNVIITWKILKIEFFLMDLKEISKL